MPRREDRYRLSVQEFLAETPPPTAAEGTEFVKTAAHVLGLPYPRALQIYQEEVNAAHARDQGNR